MGKELNTPLSLSSLLQLHDNISNKWTNIWASIDENERYRKVEHFTEAQKIEIKNQDRLPYSIPIMLAKLMPISVMQKKMRTEYEVKYAVDPSDEPKAALATLMLKDLVRQNKSDYIESEVFDDGLFIKFGVDEISVDKNGYYNKINIKMLDYKNVVWDLNAINYELDDALFMAKIDKAYRYDIESVYGKLDDVPEQNSAFNGREKTSYYINTNNLNRAYDVLSIFTHYQKANRKNYSVVFPDSAKIYGFNSVVVASYNNKKEAEEYLRELNFEYILRDMEPEGQVIEQNIQRLDKYVFTYNKILEYEETELEEFPFNVFFPMFFKGNFLSMLDFLKSPQQNFDRYWSQMDYSIGRQIKDVYQGNPELLADNESPASATKKLRKGGEIIWTKVSGQRVFEPLQSQMTSPQYLQIAEILKGFMEDLAGGRSFQGLSEGSNESGLAIEKKQMQGETIAMQFIDNFRRWKRTRGRKLLWYAEHYDNAERVITVQGNELTPEMSMLLTISGNYQRSPFSNNSGTLLINKGGISFLKDSEFELVVTESEFSESQRDKNLRFNLAAAQIMPEITQSPTWKKKTLFSLGYSFEDTQKIIDELNEMRQAMQQGAVEESNAKNDIEKAKILLQAKSLEDKKEIVERNKKGENNGRAEHS